MTLPRIKATYAILDVMAGRKKLAKHIAKHGPVRVLIEAEIIEECGRDDGESMEFECHVFSVRPVEEQS